MNSPKKKLGQFQITGIVLVGALGLVGGSMSTYASVSSRVAVLEAIQTNMTTTLNDQKKSIDSINSKVDQILLNQKVEK